MIHLKRLSRLSPLKWASQVHPENHHGSSRTPTFILSTSLLCPKVSQKSHFFSRVSQISSRNQLMPPKPPSFCNKATALFGSRGFSSDRTADDPQTSTRAGPRAVAAARAALVDYLHSTRGLNFADAERIGHNAPIYVDKLLNVVAKQEDVGRGLARFFRYNPINEFEPFFESLGLAPAEFAPFLPWNLIFLSDDEQLLESYRVLCNYGIDRGKIGRIYKEAAKVFRYEFGVLASKLQAYEGLGLSKSSVVRIVASSPALLIGEVNAEFIKLLEELEGIGIERDWIGKKICDKDVYSWGAMVMVLRFFIELGLMKEELGSLIRKHPGFILQNSGKMTFLLVGLLLKLGGTREEILSLLLEFPQVELRDFMKNLLNGLQFLIEIEMDPEDIQKTVRSHTEMLGLLSLKKPNSILTYLNVGKKRLCRIIKEDPFQLRSYALGLKLSRLPDSGDDMRSLMQKRKFLMCLGFVEDSKEMHKALRLFRGKGDELHDRFEFLVKIGLDPNDVSNMIKMAPHILNQKTDVLQHKIDFLVNGLGYPVSSLVPFPSYMSYTVERVKLRFLMYNWLKDKGKASPSLALSTILASSDKIFSKKFISRHPEGPKVWEYFKKAICSS